ncbi:hypothetical protein CC78DRAFT_479881, partial [Lojkania enalia]
NRGWLLIFGNVDRNYHNTDDAEAYEVSKYFLYAGYGSMLITSRLSLEVG